MFVESDILKLSFYHYLPPPRLFFFNTKVISFGLPPAYVFIFFFLRSQPEIGAIWAVLTLFTKQNENRAWSQVTQILEPTLQMRNIISRLEAFLLTDFD